MDIVSADFDGETWVEFDELGTPSSGGAVVLEFEDERYQVSVAPFTGRVTVEKVAAAG